MNHEEKGPRQPTDSEERRLLGKLRDLAGAYVKGCSGCDKPTWWRTDADVPICLGCTIKTNRKATNAVPRALREFLPPHPKEDHTPAPDAALGEARGTASASESLDKTQNSEQGALRASLDDLGRENGERARGLARLLLEMIEHWERGRQELDSVESLMSSMKSIADAALATASGDAPTAPLSSETAPPAPDLLRENQCEVCGRERSLAGCWGYTVQCWQIGYERLLRENARLREELASEKRYTMGAEERTKLTGDALQAEGDAHALREELTRARAAHLENATLLAKAQGALRELLRLYDWRFELAKREKDPRNLNDIPFDVETHRLLRQYGTEKKAAWGVARLVLADRKGDAAQPPLNPVGDMKHKDSCPWGPVYNECTCGPAAPAKEGK